MYQDVSNISRSIECIKEYYGASIVSRSKGEEVSNIYKVYQGVSYVLKDIKCIRCISNEGIYDILYFVIMS